MTTFTQSLFGLSEPLPLGDCMAWHGHVRKGVAPSCLKTLAKALGVNVSDVNEWATGLTKVPKSATLAESASDLVFRLAVCLEKLSEKGFSTQESATWLRYANASLKDQIPILLIRSYHGYLYVSTAIERLPRK